MTYPLLTALFFLTIALALAGGILRIWKRKWGGIRALYLAWFLSYTCFILFLTGPRDRSLYPPPISSPYKLPWKAGDRRFVAQGNRSFNSHRDRVEYSWDFWMAVGTEVLAAREGRVVEVEDSFDGIGLRSNYLVIEHPDGTRGGYAHIRYRGALVKIGERVRQGQPIAHSGMVGQTLFPHLHFGVENPEGTATIPISFADVPDGVPLAGQSYTSRNTFP
jgi:murein DD-endopeptidase MepM/ murein hydrolase activator NlpD